MAKLIRPASPTSVVLRLKLMDATSTSGAGKIGITSGSTGLNISTIRLNESAPVSYKAVSATIQDIATLGTYVAPDANSCRFKEVDATNMPGLYELQLADARFTSIGVIISINGVTGLAQADFEIQCENIGVQVKGLDANVITSAGIASNVRATLASSQPDYAPALQSSLITDVAVITAGQTTIISKEDSISANQTTIISKEDSISANQTIIISKENSISASISLLGTPMQSGTDVVLSASQPRYRPAVSGDQMLLSAGAIGSDQFTLLAANQVWVATTSFGSTVRANLGEAIWAYSPRTVTATGVTFDPTTRVMLSATQPDYPVARETTLIPAVASITGAQQTIISKENSISANQAIIIAKEDSISATESTIVTNTNNIYSRIGTPVSGSISQDIQNISTAVVAGVPQNFTEISGALINGTTISNAPSATILADSNYWTTAPSGTALSGFGLIETLSFNVGTTRVSQVSILGRFAAGAARAVNIQAWNYSTSAFDSLSNASTAMINSATDATFTYTLLSNHQDSAGNVIIRFTSTSTTTGDRLNLDQVLVKAVAAGATAAEIAQAVYDKMRYVVYNGAVYVDTVNGFTGTDLGINGLETHPSNNMADAVAIATNIGIKHLIFIADSVVTLSASFAGWRLEGRAFISLNGQNITDTEFVNNELVSGIGIGDDATFDQCILGQITLGPCLMRGCGFSNTITLGAGGDYFFDQCFSMIAGDISTNSPIIDFDAAGANNVSLRHYAGGIKLDNMGSTDKITVAGTGLVNILSGSTSGTVVIRGSFELLNNGNSMTIVDAARWAEDQNITHVTGNVSGSVNSVVSGVNLNSTNRIVLSATQPDYAPALQSTLNTDVAVITGNQNTIISKEDSISATEDSILTGVKTTTGDTGTIISKENSISASIALLGSPMQSGTDVVLSASQPRYRPSISGDKMDLVDAPNTVSLDAIADEIWRTILQYKNTDGSLQQEKAWVMLQSIFSLLKDKTTTL